MPLKIGRRPYHPCPWRWALTVAGVSTGEGDVSDAQCLDLVGDFNLDWRGCQSQHNLLVWSGDCEPDDAGDGCCCLSFRISGVSGTGSEVVNGLYQWPQCYEYGGTIGWQIFNDQGYYAVIGSDFPGYGISAITGLVFERRNNTTDAASYVGGEKAFEHVGDVLCCKTATVTLNDETTWPGSSGWPSEIVLFRSDGTTGPNQNDRIRSKWHLEYNIAETKWTLRSFNRIDYPIYSLIDADPCTGNEKILTLEDQPEGAVDGCANAPPTVTITRACPPERAAREHKRSKQTGQLRRPCGCACDDEVDDRRSNQCVSTSTAGCETWDEDQIECKFPAGSDCCTYCEEDKAPCAYEALTTCDLAYNGIPIMAKVVTLRHDCYFSDTPCEWVGAGPEVSAAGSPVMDVNGYPGAQPICATCADSCLTGCSWDAWQTATCPGPCGPNLCAATEAFTCDFPAMTGPTSGTECSAAETFNLTKSTPLQQGTFVWRYESSQMIAEMTIRENCVELIIEASINYCAGDGVGDNGVYDGFPNTGACPDEIVFTKRAPTSATWPDTLIVTRA